MIELAGRSGMAGAVNAVPQYWMTNMGQVNPDLMGPTGFQLATYKSGHYLAGVCRKSTNGFVMRNGPAATGL